MLFHDKNINRAFLNSFLDGARGDKICNCNFMPEGGCHFKNECKNVLFNIFVMMHTALLKKDPVFWDEVCERLADKFDETG